MLNGGFTTIEVERCVYTKLVNNDCVIICLYVDDMLIFGTNMNVVNDTKLFLASNFDMKDLGEAKVILGVKIIRNDSGIILSQEHYVEKILRKFEHYDVFPYQVPYDQSVNLIKHEGDPLAQSEYAKIIGSLLHLMNFTRLDIAYAMCRLSKYAHCPSNGHWTTLLRVLRYLRGTMNYGIHYSGFSNCIRRIQ